MNVQKLYHRAIDWSDALSENEPHLSVVPFIGFIGGILIYFNLSFEPPLFFISILFLLSGLCCFIPCSRGIKFLFQLTPLFCILGILVCCLQTHFTHTKFIPHAALNVHVSGIVTEVQPHTDRAIVYLKPSAIYFLDTKTGLKTPVFEKEFYPPKIRLTAYRSHLKVNPGDKITGTVFKLTQPPPALTSYTIGQNVLLWFEGVGAVGTMRQFHIERKPSEDKEKFYQLDLLRERIHTVFQRTFKNENAGIAEALVLGGSNYVTDSSRRLYRALGISHILSVSGFHIGLIMCLVLGIIRLIFCFFPDVFSAIFVRRIAIVFSLISGGVYVVLSQAHIPAVRAYVMMCFLFAALFFDKRALSLRTVFMAAFILLCLRPYLILSVSFQLSFAAVLCLVGVYDIFRSKFKIIRNQSYVKRLFLIFLTFILLNLFVTLITLPFVAYHFHQVALYGVAGNLLFASCFAFLIIPLLFLGVLLIAWPIADYPLQMADTLLSGINQTGLGLLNGTEGFLTIPYFHTYGLVCWAVGLMGFVLFQTRIRWMFVGLMGVFFISFVNVEKPVAMIGAGGNYAGIYQDNQFRVTESYYYPVWHAGFLLFYHQTPPQTLPQRLKQKEFQVGSFRLSQTKKTCQRATLSIRRKGMEKCPHLISIEDMLDLYSISVYQKDNNISFDVAGYRYKNRPWHNNTPRLPIDEAQIKIRP